MAAIKLQKFMGRAPKVSPELLPDGAAQIAVNTQLYSGDLLPYPETATVDSVPRAGVIKTIFGMRDPNTSALEWLTWLADVDIVIASDSSDDEQRFYFTGDGVPKVSTFALATTGSEPYPVASYDLGLPLPSTTPLTTAASFTAATSTHYERDSGNTAIITTAAAHGLRSGIIITVRGFSGTVPEVFNVVNTRITVTSSTTFEYFNAGATVAKASNTSGIVDLSGGTVTRDYIYTWITPWDEESIASLPSTTLFIKEGQIISVSGLPTAAPAGDNFIMGMKLYRTLTSASGTDFYHVETLWWPLATTTVALTSNVATVTFADHHNLIVDDVFKISGCTDSTFNITAGVVVSVPTDTSITYAVVASNIASKADTTGILYHDVSELPGDTARYFGDNSIKTTLRERTSNVATLTTAAAHGLLTGHVVTIASMSDTDYNAADVSITKTGATTFTYANTASNETSTSDTAGVITNDSFLDDFDFLNLVDLLLTDDYDAPKSTMTGLILGQNSLLAGFFDNQLAFAEPSKPHAWPLEYRRTFEENIVALASVGGTILVLTELFAYRVSGAHPSTLSIARIDTPYPCTSKRSVINMGYGVLYATYGGLAIWSPTGGLTLATKSVEDYDTWDTDIDPSTVVAHFFDDKYFGSHSGGAFLFERNDKTGGTYVSVATTFNSAWTDPSDNATYLSSDALGNIIQWASSSNPVKAFEWKSKVLVTKDYINIGAARVVADYAITAEDTAAYTAYNTSVVTINTATWLVAEQFATINGPTDFLISGVTHNNLGEFNRNILHGSNLLLSLRTAPTSYTMTFELWQNKSLVFSTSTTDSEIFRCPVGYKSDTFEIGLSGSARVRAVHLGETPNGLRQA